MKDQHKAGIPPKPRGQQTGFAGNSDQNREEMKNTPALRGRKRANKMFADASEEHVAGSSSTPSTNDPSTVINLGAKKHRKNQA